MSFLIIGLILLGIGIYFLRQKIQAQDKFGIMGMTMVIVAAVVMILFYGLFYTLSIP
jgi:high-affinity Fe2+/Pb2+ permease